MKWCISEDANQNKTNDIEARNESVITQEEWEQSLKKKLRRTTGFGSSETVRTVIGNRKRE